MCFWLPTPSVRHLGYSAPCDDITGGTVTNVKDAEGGSRKHMEAVPAVIGGLLCQTILVSQIPVIYVAEGGSVVLPCHYSISGEKITTTIGSYKWYKDVVQTGLEVSNGHKEFSGRVFRADTDQFISERSAAIVLQRVGFGDSGMYYCEVTFQLGRDISAHGNGTFLNVTGLGGEVWLCPDPDSRHIRFLSQTIQVSQPPVIYGTEGRSITLPCNYSISRRENVIAGNYKWYRHLVRIGPEVSDNNPDFTGRISRADVSQFIEGRSAAITLHNVDPVDTGLYYCEVTFQGRRQVSGDGNGTFLNVTADVSYIYKRFILLKVMGFALILLTGLIVYLCTRYGCPKLQPKGTM
ncbi:uncharacterized protein [Hyperolius riggenbachi]|uniref:uncharacterized protein n=1 Tax=Hyperolius riggenbachi TaxID=752182 RepID=UPI0035A37089